MSSSGSNDSGSFAKWLEQQRDIESGGTGKTSDESSFSLLGQLSSVQEGFTNQLQELSGQLPDTAAFRARVGYAVYCILGSVFFGGLAIVVGLPLLVVKPSKFVICMSLSTLLGASSVIILQRPAVFFSTLLSGGISNATPVLLLLASVLSTIYATLFIHTYIIVVTMGSLQVLALLYYIAAFIPGGTQGLSILLKSTYMVVSTAMAPCIFVCKRTLMSLFRQLIS